MRYDIFLENITVEFHAEVQRGERLDWVLAIVCQFPEEFPVHSVFAPAAVKGYRSFHFDSVLILRQRDAAVHDNYHFSDVDNLSLPAVVKREAETREDYFACFSTNGVAPHCSKADHDRPWLEQGDRHLGNVIFHVGALALAPQLADEVLVHECESHPALCLEWELYHDLDFFAVLSDSGRCIEFAFEAFLAV